MATPREELIELVEAYAAAKKSENQLLINVISQRLGGFLQGVDIVKPVAVPDEIKEAVKPKPARRTRKTES